MDSLDFQNNPPEWNNEGIEPSEELKNDGFKPGYKPPAAYFNWFFNGVFKCLQEVVQNIQNLWKDMNKISYFEMGRVVAPISQWVYVDEDYHKYEYVIEDERILESHVAEVYFPSGLGSVYAKLADISVKSNTGAGNITLISQKEPIEDIIIEKIIFMSGGVK